MNKASPPHIFELNSSSTLRLTSIYCYRQNKMLKVILWRCPQLHLYLNFIQEYSIMTVTESSTGHRPKTGPVGRWASLTLTITNYNPNTIPNPNLNLNPNPNPRFFGRWIGRWNFQWFRSIIAYETSSFPWNFDALQEKSWIVIIWWNDVATASWY